MALSSFPWSALMHGRFHVEQDRAGQDVVTTNEGDPVKNVTQLGKAENASPAGANLTPAAFKAAIQAKLQSAK